MKALKLRLDEYGRKLAITSKYNLKIVFCCDLDSDSMRYNKRLWLADIYWSRAHTLNLAQRDSLIVGKGIKVANTRHPRENLSTQSWRLSCTDSTYS